MILAARFRLAPAADIDRPGMELAHGTLDVVRCQTPGYNHRVQAGDGPGLRPRPCSPGAADGVWHPGIQQRMGPVLEAGGGQVFTPLPPEGPREEQTEPPILLGGGAAEL